METERRRPKKEKEGAGTNAWSGILLVRNTRKENTGAI
jgi:hypothetical protein